MFRVRLVLPSHEIQGVAALDERRRLGLPDGSHLVVSEPTISIEVSEGFARRFDIFKGDSHPDAMPLLEWLQPGDLVGDEGNNIRAVWNNDVKPERLRELALLALLDGRCKH
jgi:hypothetical protein